MEAPALPARPTKRPVPPIPTANSRKSTENCAAANDDDDHPGPPPADWPRAREESPLRLRTQPNRRGMEDVQSLISRAPSVPSTLPVVVTQQADACTSPVTGETRRMDTAGADSVEASRVRSQSSGPASSGKSAEAFGSSNADAGLEESPPPPYNGDFTPLPYPDVKVEPDTAAAPSLNVPAEGALVESNNMLSAPAWHRRAYSDCAGMESAPPAPPDTQDDESSSADRASAEPSSATLNPPSSSDRGWRQKFTNSRGHASDTEMLPDEREAHAARRHVPGEEIAQGAGEGGGGNGGPESGPPPPANGGPPDPGPPPSPGPPPPQPPAPGSPHVRSEPYSNSPVRYPTLGKALQSQNPLHPPPTLCELREEWEPGFDPAFSSRTKIHSLFTGKSWKETPWKPAWIELLPEEGWKLAFFDIVKARNADGISVYSKKPQSAPFQTFSLKHASCSPPRTGYGSQRTEILSVRLVSGRYLVLSFPASSIKSDWTKAVKSAIEMATRFQKGGTGISK
ncbi:hypothetical protein HDU87_004124 [Geranomyces variabilis]|uniref:PH domain-containing protein n=1 Tax=Geranomyces variabilis TaxID=109894 RepID=A0AAD5TR77_9FUNG|nr:hypothetical protein HDU87_004124 [Geranomyces variabilis]